MNSSIRKLFYVTVALFAGLMGMLVYLQMVNAKSLADNPHNTRKVYEQMRIQRGLILASDKTVLAQNQKQDNLYYRTYPQGDFAAQLIGYSDPTYGQTGLEHSMNDYLTGTADEVELTNFVDTLLGREQRGADVKLTIDPKVQSTAAAELDKLGKRGSVVVLDVHTGAVLAMVSSPTFDLNNFQANWQQLNSDPDAPLLNRATQGLYTPGSSFKLITTAAALESGQFTPDSKFRDDKGSIEINGNVIHNWTDVPFGEHNFAEAFSESINTTFAQVGEQLGQSKLEEYQQKFGLYQKPPLELPPDEIAASGRYVNGQLASPGDSMDPVQVAWMAIGQENVQVTPLQMAMIAQAIGNGGKEMKPYAVDSVMDYNGTVIKQASPEMWKQPIRADTAATMTQMMIKVVNEGTGLGAKTAKVQIAGKTGTAEVGGNKGPNAWFVGFAPANNPQVAIAVVVEDADERGHDSSPIARDTLLAALGLPPGQ